MPIKRGSLICRWFRWLVRAAAICGSSSAGLGKLMATLQMQSQWGLAQAIFFKPALQQQGGCECVDWALAVAAVLPLLQALALGLVSGQAFVVGVHGQVE